MKKAFPLVLLAVVALAFVWTLFFLYNKSKGKPEVFDTMQAKKQDIVKRTVASGSIVPRREIALKPRVSGILSDILVEPGRSVKKGEVVAKIKIVPNVINVNGAQSRGQQSRISFDNAKKEFERNKELFAQGVISETELSRFKLDYELRAQEKTAANSNLQLIKSGSAKGSKQVSNVVKATVPGMVIAVPVKAGASVTEANNFNEGTTIASIADMNDMIFEGFVDESEVAKLKSGMTMEIIMGALDDKQFTGRLEYISPKGITLEGTIQFEIRAALVLPQAEDEKTVEASPFVRAGYSANAKIVLDKKEDVLSIDESLLQFDKDGKTYVEIETGDQTFERKDVELGLSDGVVAEVLNGLDGTEKIKLPISKSDDKES